MAAISHDSLSRDQEFKLTENQKNEASNVRRRESWNKTRSSHAE